MRTAQCQAAARALVARCLGQPGAGRGARIRPDCGGRLDESRNVKSRPHGTAPGTVPAPVPHTHHFLSADLISSSSVPVTRFGLLAAPYRILYFPGATQIVGVPTTSISSSFLA